MLRVTTQLRFIEPQLVSPVDQPPEGKHWIHEIKHDGYRCQVLVERGQARVFTRNGFDWTDRYPSFVRAASKLRCKSAIIDGDVKLAAHLQPEPRRRRPMSCEMRQGVRVRSRRHCLCNYPNGWRLDW